MKRVVIILSFMCLVTSAVFASTYMVTSNTDDGTGTVPGTLSWAIIQSNASADVDDTIIFNLNSGSTITISAQMPEITDAVTIDGTNAVTSSDVTVQVTTPGASAWRVFNINASDKTVNISNMTINGGDVSENSDCNGGGIYISDPNYTGTTVNLDYVTVSDSKAMYGGGIFVSFNCVLTLDHCTVKNNSAYKSESSSTYAFAQGGGIFAITAGVSINNSTISGNTAYAINTTSSGRAYAYGGGLHFEGGAKQEVRTFSINNSTVFGNIANSLSSTSTAGSAGGGIYAMEDGVITNCTISGNELISSGTTSGTHGAGVAWYQGTAEITNSIFADNTNNETDYDFYNYYATLTDNGYNIIEYSNIAAIESDAFSNKNDILYNTKYNESGTSFTNWSRNGVDLDNQNLNLASAMADNGGPTETLAVESGSFAIGAGLYDASYPTDQRGESRNDPPTIGAYEAALFVWCGTIDTDWNTSGNWVDDEVPNAASSVTIPVDCSNYPVINEDVVCKNITIKDGGSLQVISSYSLNIAGDFTLDDGSSFTNNGTLQFSGDDCHLNDNRTIKNTLGSVLVQD